MEIVNSKLKVAVLAGGVGQERQVSLQSGDCIGRALEQGGLNVIGADISPDDVSILDDGSIDIFFIALHGKFGEDGQLQQILEDKNLLYTGSGSAASKLAFDKIASKKTFEQIGVDTPEVIEFSYDSDPEQVEKQLCELGEKFVVKPVRQGSSVGISIIGDPARVLPAAHKCLNEFGDCMIERFIAGREITVGVLCDQALPIIEIKPKSGFYDYHAKYVDEETGYLFDTIESSDLRAELKAAAIDCFNAIGCSDFARVDFIVDDSQVGYVLEVNTIPGFTTHSLLPKAAAQAGMPMSRLCVKIIEAALKNKKITAISR